MNTFTLTTLGLALLATQASASLVVTNGSFELGSDINSNPVNLELIDSWFEEIEAGSSALIGEASSEQLLQEGGNRPMTTAGSYWGHFIDQNGVDGFSAIYQNVGSLAAGDLDQYVITGLLGERSNRDWPTSGLKIEFFAVPMADVGGEADGVALADAFSSEVLLDMLTITEFNGTSGTAATANFSATVDLSGAAPTDYVFLRFSQTVDVAIDGNSQTHILFDDITLTAVPEPSTVISLILGGLVVFGLLRRRRL